MSRPVVRGVELVLFDLDGTLVETAPEIHDAVNDTLGAMDLPAVTLGKVASWIGHGTGRLLAQALADATGGDGACATGGSLLRAAQARFDIDYERRCGTTSRPYAHALEVLLALGASGVRRALVTNKERRFTLPVLRWLGLCGLFVCVVCGDSLPSRKPDPAGVQHCLREFDVPAHRALFIGDSSIDVATARNAGVRVWAVSYGYNGGAPVAASRPDRLIDSLEPLFGIASRLSPALPAWVRADPPLR